MKAINIIGNGYGKLTVIKKDKSKRRGYYICKCECGNFKSIRSDGLRSGGTKSCGCWQREFNKTNLRGKRFGRLVVVEERPKKNRVTRWLCQCDCGNKKEVDTKHLVYDAGTRSCGCFLKEHNEKYRLLYGESSFNRLLSLYKRGAKKRNLEFDLNDSQFKILTQQNCHYCGTEPLTIKSGKTYYGEYIYNGIDRIDNNKGYTSHNCVSCCHICNKMKMKLSVDDFLDRIKKIYKNCC